MATNSTSLLSKIYTLEAPAHLFPGGRESVLRELPDGTLVTSKDFAKFPFKVAEIVRVEAKFVNVEDVLRDKIGEKLPVFFVEYSSGLLTVELDVDEIKKRKLSDKKICSIINRCAYEVGLIEKASTS